MSILMEFAIFPTDKGASVSEYVSKVINMIKNECNSYKLTAMGTIVETNSFEEALDILNKSYKILEQDSDRIYSSVKFDIRKSKVDRINNKIKSIEDKIGNVNK